MQRRTITTILIATFAILTTACAGGGALSAEQTAALSAAEANAGSLQLTSDFSTTQMLDGRSGQIVDLSQVVTGDRPVLLWYWAPTWVTCLSEGSDVEQFARDNSDVLQVIGVGAQDDFEGVQNFLNSTGMEDTAMLWERQGNFWQLQNVSHNSAMQLYSYDLTQQSVVLFFNDQGREIVLDAAIQTPWAPVESASSS